MPEQRHIVRLGRSLVVVIPPRLIKHLGVSRGAEVYLFRVRRKEVVLSASAVRKGGHPEGLTLERQLGAAEKELALLRQRNEARDRSMYAEGYQLGYAKATERLTAPYGRSGEGQRRRQLYAQTFSEAARAERRERRKRSTPKVEAVETPVLEPPPETAPPVPES